jgi:hypothetical protein
MGHHGVVRHCGIDFQLEDTTAQSMKKAPLQWSLGLFCSGSFD